MVMRALEDIPWKVAPGRMLKIHDASDRLKCCSAMLRGAADRLVIGKIWDDMGYRGVAPYHGMV